MVAILTDNLKWETVAKKKRADRELILAQYPEWRVDESKIGGMKDVSHLRFSELSKRELEIVSYDATALLQFIRDKHFTSSEVIRAYCHAAIIAQDTTNCLTEIFFVEAFQRADELDKHIEATGKTVGPLHGLPVSIKDHIKIKGKDTSTGYVAWCYKTIADEDAVAVDILRQAGAILYVKTNNPQTLMSLETNNNIFGRTDNPYNRDLTAGGSSGGESALIALHGSPLGIGTDIGGSIRLPAATTGLYGFKASVARIPHAGLLGSHDGIDTIQGALGPLARSARDLSLFCQVMLQNEPWRIEPPLLEIPWKQEIVEGQGLPSRLSFAILWSDGVVAPDPPMSAALQKCRDQLISAGHEVIDWEPMEHEAAWDLIMKLYFLDGGEEYREVLQESGEPAVSQTEWILGQIENPGKSLRAREIFKLNLERESFRLRLARHWNSTKDRTTTGRMVDAIISPVAPTLAPRHNTTNWWGYTSYWNLADYPGAVFPIGDCRTLVNEFSKVPTSSTNGDVANSAGSLSRFASPPWDLELHANLPVCLQLIGRRLNEEKVLGMLNVVEEAISGAHPSMQKINASDGEGGK